MVTFLDLEQLTAELGDQYVILLRGHSRTMEGGERVAQGGVIDVTTYPEVTELFMAADAMITDYSSVMFDYSITRRPMIFFVPDMDDYRDSTRGVYFDLSEVAPGPVLATQAEVDGRDPRAGPPRGPLRRPLRRLVDPLQPPRRRPRRRTGRRPAARVRERDGPAGRALIPFRQCLRHAARTRVRAHWRKKVSECAQPHRIARRCWTTSERGTFRLASEEEGSGSERNPRPSGARTSVTESRAWRG